jgi:citrate lyase subunit beta / citryl-CoA lyase
MATPEVSGLRVWRSLLFVPANVSKFYDKAVASDPDAIVLDLEDGVAPTAKVEAREAVSGAVAACSAGGADIVVRINRPLGLAVRDMEAVISQRVAALMLPKIESADHVRMLAEVADACESRVGLPRGHTRFYVVVENARAFRYLFDIAAAHSRIVAFTCGTEDFTASTGSQPDPDVLLYPKQQGIIAARAAGVIPMGILASGADFRDLDGLRAAVHKSRRFGVEGSTCIHPSQVAILNEGFTPKFDEIEKARQIVASHEQGLAIGLGAVAYEGSMVDAPVVERARRILAIAARGGTTSQKNNQAR